MSNTSCRSIREHLKFVHEKNESQPASVYQLKNVLEKTNLSLQSRNLKAYKSTTEQNAREDRIGKNIKGKMRTLDLHNRTLCGVDRCRSG